ncbi:hypothetical protein CPB84DRAFT_1790621, partial [Gymnopilus junonius]
MAPPRSRPTDLRRTLLRSRAIAFLSSQILLNPSFFQSEEYTNVKYDKYTSVSHLLTSIEPFLSTSPPADSVLFRPQQTPVQFPAQVPPDPPSASDKGRYDAAYTSSLDICLWQGCGEASRNIVEHLEDAHEVFSQYAEDVNSGNRKMRCCLWVGCDSSCSTAPLLFKHIKRKHLG